MERRGIERTRRSAALADSTTAGALGSGAAAPQLHTVARSRATPASRTGCCRFAPTPREAEAAVDDTALGRWGHLQLVEKIGAGTFGEVFRAWDPRLEREVALKLLKPAGAPLDSLAERVLHEGRLLARVRHPNVLTVFEAESREGRVGICMEFIKGQTLDQVLDKQGPFGAREALLVGLDLCRALAAVHNSGLVHRDVKAQNVMREEGGRIVLMDFSSGQELREPGGTVLPSMAGTPLYLAPEILSGRDATVRSDIYSVGVLLYHLVTASYPIRTKTMEELWKAHKQGQFKRLRDARPDLPERFVQAVERAIAGNPDERYESAGDMEAALMSALEVSPLTISATPRPLTAVPAAESASAAVTPAEAWIGRRAVAVGAGMLAVLLAAIYWGAGSRENTATPAPVTAGQIERIAVLPFENVTGSQEASDLAAAVPLELTARLGQIGALKVVPWSYMRTLDPGATRTITDVGRATNADAIVDGSVQVMPGTSNNRTVRVAVQVFHAGTGVLLWSGAFDRPLADFLKLQGDLAQAIASELKVKLARREEMLLARAPQVDPEAMELYLKGRQAWDERDADGLRRGLEYFRLAADRDPNFAAAHVGIADSYALLSAYYHAVSGKEAYTRAMDATSRALAIDNMLAEAWTSRAFVRYVFGWEWEAAQADFSRALELDPASVLTHHWYADYLTTLGRHDEAIRESHAGGRARPVLGPCQSSCRLVVLLCPAVRRCDRTAEEDAGARA